MFEHFSKHREQSWKYGEQRSTLTNFEVFENVVDTSSQSNPKREKHEKQNRKNLR